MLVARATTRAGTDLLILGLSAENRRRLADGQPITTTVPQLGRQLHVIIFAGETEEAMQAALQPLIGKDTVVHDWRAKEES